MRDQDEGIGIVRQIVFQPVAGFEVEMVGRLVEQQKIRFLQQQLGQRQPHLPAAGKSLGLAVPIVLHKSQPCKNGADLRFDGVPVTGLEFVLDQMVTIGDLRIFRRGMVHLGHAGGEVLHLLLHGAKIVEDRHALGKHTASGEREAILRQISRADAFGSADRTVVQGFETTQDFEQRGLAGAVCAHQANAVFRGDQPVGFFKQKLVAIAFPG